MSYKQMYEVIFYNNLKQLEQLVQSISLAAYIFKVHLYTMRSNVYLPKKFFPLNHWADVNLKGVENCTLFLKLFELSENKSGIERITAI